MTKNWFWTGLVLVLGVSGLAVNTWAWQGGDTAASVERGKAIYNTQCITCHRDAGQGVKDVYPPLAKSDYLMANKLRAIDFVLKGHTGEITVNGEKYDNEMLPIDLPDQDVADVLTFVRNSWGNKGPAVKPAEVAAQRKK